MCIRDRIITDWSYIAIAMTIVWTHLIYNNFARENRLKLQIKKQFEHYLEPKMVKKLQQNPDLLKLGGETKELTFLFCDIRGFTPLSEKYQKNPAELTKVINKFLTPMTEIIMRNGGTIDKFIGDAILVFFGDPESDGLKKDASKCLSMAIAMQNKVAELDKSWREDHGIAEGLKVRIGISTGYCTVGNFGSVQRVDYTVLGSTVNLASRLESICQPKKILVAPETKVLLEKDFKLNLRQTFLFSTLAWVTVAIFGSLPFVLSNQSFSRL